MSSMNMLSAFNQEFERLPTYYVASRSSSFDSTNNIVPGE